MDSRPYEDQSGTRSAESTASDPVKAHTYVGMVFHRALVHPPIPRRKLVQGRKACPSPKERTLHLSSDVPVQHLAPVDEADDALGRRIQSCKNDAVWRGDVGGVRRGPFIELGWC